MFDERCALELFERFLNLSPPVEAKQIGVLVSFYRREREERGIVCEITGTEGHHVGEQHLVRVCVGHADDVLNVFLDCAEKLLKKIPSDVDPDTHYHEDMRAVDLDNPTYAASFLAMFRKEPRNDLDLEKSGPPTPEAVRPALRACIEARYTGYKLNFVQA